MLQAEFEWPTIDTVRLIDTEYDIQCPKCSKLAFTHRDNSDNSTAFKCPNCSSGVLLTKDYWRFNQGNGDYEGRVKDVYLTCEKECGWETIFKKGDRLKHDECGAEIGPNFISSPAIEEYDIEENDPGNKGVKGFFRKLIR